MKKIILTLIASLLLFISIYAQDVRPIQFENKTWTPNALNTFDSWLTSDYDVVEGKAIRLLQFDLIPSVERISQMSENGIILSSYFPDYTYLATVETNVSIHELLRNNVIAISELPEEVKISKDILRGDIGDWALNGNQLEIVLLYHKGLSLNVVQKIMEKEGVSIRTIHPDYHIIKATIDVNRVYDIAALDVVQFLSVESEPGQPEDTEGRSLHRSNLINSSHSSGLKYDGTGVGIQPRDDGFLGPHIDFHGRLKTNAFGIVGTIDHMDGVAGIFGGAGNVNPDNRGMASGADIYATNYIDNFLDNTLDLHQTEGVMVTNSSYSNGCNAGYTIITRTVDLQIEENPSLLHVFSAGNSGSSSCNQNNYGAGNRWGNITGGHKQGKNVIATANLRIDVTLEPSSSRGPAHDGRIKPDLAARGTGQVSTDPNNGYSGFGGTSAASPGVAGVCAQLYHAYRDLNNGETPHSALIKASLLNTANDLGNVGPDFLFGWGHINAGRAYKLLKEKRYESSTINQAEEKEHTFNIPDGVKEARFMLYWREPNATPGAAKALINDLDLAVKFNSDTFLPYLLNHSPNPITLNMPAGNGVDHLNNVEQVVFRSPEAGEYTIVVSGSVLPFGARDYFILYEQIDESITLTYPYGGESFTPGTIEQIHWDAIDGNELFTIEYSLDDGMTWNMIGTSSGNSKIYSWDVPEVITSQGKIRISRNGEESVNEIAFHIAQKPKTISVQRICPNFIEFVWPIVESAISYDVYMLGEKYMEIVATVDTNYARVMVDNVLDEHWYALRIKTEEGAIGQRTNALFYDNGITNCVINKDIELIEVISPNSYLVYTCGDLNEGLKIKVRNNGIEVVDDVIVEYELSNGLMGGETFNVTLQPNEEIVLEMMDVINIKTSGDYEITIIASTSGDELVGNNELSYPFKLNNLSNTSVGLPFYEDFEGDFPPQGWDIFSELEKLPSDTKWHKDTVIGVSGGSTSSITLGTNVSREVLSSDEFYSRDIDLTNATNPVVDFDYAIHIDNSSNFDGNISLVVYSFCDNRIVDELFKAPLNLFKTSVASAVFPWVPNQSGDWQKLLFDLSPFVGSKVVLGWIVENGQFFNINIDNINVKESNIEIPSGDFSVSKTNICATFDPITFQVENSDPNNEYQWSFSGTASPSTASGPGPHIVRFFQEGAITITLLVRNPKTGAYVQKDKVLNVYKRPSANFSFDVNQGTVDFTNKSSNALTYLWDFGDGTTSAEVNPTHIYTSTGIFEVKLSSTNECTTRERTLDVEIGTLSSEDVFYHNIDIYPNPTTNDIYINKNGLILEGNFIITDLTGRTLVQYKLNNENLQIVPMSRLNTGTYIVQLVIEGKTKSYRIVKIK